MQDLFGKVELRLDMQQSLSHGMVYMTLEMGQVTWKWRNKAKTHQTWLLDDESRQSGLDYVLGGQKRVIWLWSKLTKKLIVD